MSKLKALILVETLKSTSKISNTLILSPFFPKPLSVHDTECEIVRLADRDIKSGVYTNIGLDDDWSAILEKILISDIIIFATPVWRGNSIFANSENNRKTR